MPRSSLVARLLAPLLVALGGAALLACGGTPDRDRPAEAGAGGTPRLVTVLPARNQLAFVDPERGVTATVAVGDSPWGVALARGRAYVSTAKHVAIVDLARRAVVARVPYRTRTGAPEVGEYRAGGMGIAAEPDGRRVYVGVHPEGGGPGRLEVLDPERRRMIESAPIGERPFDVLAPGDGRTVYTLDHDSYGVSAVDARAGTARRLRVAPLGTGAFDKLNYGALDRRGRLLLPINGEVLATLDPRTARVATRPMRSRVHQAGAVRAGGRLLTVGAEALEGGGPNLSVFDLATGRERLVRLRRPHEDVAVSAGGEDAYLSGGYTRGGWKGVTVVPLDGGRPREVALPDAPLGIAALPG